MRSNACAVTGPAGCAMPHAVGTTLWPALRTSSTKPEMPMFNPSIVASMASPSLAPGQAPVRAKSSQVVG